jgi:hypothetical protein
MKYRRHPQEVPRDEGLEDDVESIMNPTQGVPFYKQPWFIPISVLTCILIWLQLSPTDK